jgi:hypothetical protein
MAELDVRKLLAGHDPAQVIRAGAKDLLETAIKNGLRREHEALAFKYETHPELSVFISQVNAKPPRWRLVTTVDPIGRIEVVEEREELLEPELRFRVAHALVSGSHCGAAEARTRAANMRVRKEHVLLRDSQRHDREWNR